MKNLCRLTALLITLNLPAMAGQEYSGRPRQVTFRTEDGGTIYANLYGKGDSGVVLAHGGRFNKESWEKQASALVRAGFRVLAFDFRGRGKSEGPGQADMLSAPLHLDVLAAVRYLRKTGVKSVSVIGASMGGGAAGDASIESDPGEIDRIVFLASQASLSNRRPELVKGRKLFILTRDDYSGDARIPRLPAIRAHYERTTGPKELIILEGSAHAQFIFETDQAERLMREILRFLTEP